VTRSAYQQWSNFNFFPDFQSTQKICVDEEEEKRTMTTPATAPLFAATKRRIDDQAQLKLLNDKFAGTRSQPAWVTNVTNVTNVTDGGAVAAEVIFYWYFRQAMDKYKQFKLLRERVALLRTAKLISPATEQKWNLLIDIQELSFWELGIDVLNRHEYKDVVGQLHQVVTVPDLTMAMFELDAIANRADSHVGSSISGVSTGDRAVTERDRLCMNEYVETDICDQTACQLNKPLFGGKFVCRSVIR
jgi:hypothetical protein